MTPSACGRSRPAPGSTSPRFTTTWVRRPSSTRRVSPGSSRRRRGAAEPWPPRSASVRQTPPDAAREPARAARRVRRLPGGGARDHRPVAAPVVGAASCTPSWTQPTPRRCTRRSGRCSPPPRRPALLDEPTPHIAVRSLVWAAHAHVVGAAAGAPGAGNGASSGPSSTAGLTGCTDRRPLDGPPPRDIIHPTLD